MAGTVVGYFTSEAQAETAVSALRTAGFPSSQIGIALSSMSGATGYPDTAGYDATGNAETGTSSSAHAGHAAGAAVASAWDRFKNFFEGSDENDGVNAAHSHEVTAGSGYEYEHDDVAHSLSGLAVPEDRSRYFTHRFGSQGQGAVVTVTASGREAEAESILEANGGDVGNNTADYDYSAPVAPTGQQKIQLLGEVLRVQKDRISRGEVRIRKEVITEQQTIQVPVTREELVIERIPVSGTTAVAGEIGGESEIRIPLSEERASFDKQTVVREEVAIGKREVENVQEVGGSVRHEELEVEDGTTTTAPASKLS